MTATEPTPAPTPPQAEEEAVAARHEAVPTEVDRLGRGVEPVRPVSAEAAAHWDETVWGRVG